eukprot:NODE_233_length_13658_cov_0.453647.p14 type:complete len:100 gc:universal NODE_233_length_13658_cov_0.453647:5231-5530(+)
MEESFSSRLEKQKLARLKILEYNKEFLKEFKKPVDYHDSIRFQRKRKRDMDDKDYTLEEHENYKKKNSRGKKKKKAPDTEHINLKNRLFNQQLEKYYSK